MGYFLEVKYGGMFVIFIYDKRNSWIVKNFIGLCLCMYIFDIIISDNMFFFGVYIVLF